MRYLALLVANFLEVYAFECYKSDQIVVFDIACIFELRLPQRSLWLRLRRLICFCSVSNKGRSEPWSWAEPLKHSPVGLRMRGSHSVLRSYPTPSGVVGNIGLVL